MSIWLLLSETKKCHREILARTHLSSDVGLGAGVGVQPRDGQLRVGERRAAAPQLLLGARVQLETVFQNSQFLDEQKRRTWLLQIV